MTRAGLEDFGRRLGKADEVVIKATGNCMAVARVLSPFVKRVVIANPLQVKAIAHAHVKTDKVDAGTLASLYEGLERAYEWFRANHGGRSASAARVSLGAVDPLAGPRAPIP